MKKKVATLRTHSKTISKVALIVGLVVAGFITSQILQSCTQVKAFCTAPSSDTNQITQLAPQFFNYDKTLLEQSVSEGKKVILYFHAPWCTSCSNFEQEMLAPGDKLPTDMVVLKIDFDSSSTLKQQYGVLHQHTLVLLDLEGNVREMWIGGDLASLKEYLGKHL